MSQTITQSRLRIDANFKRFVDEEVLPGTGLDAAADRKSTRLNSSHRR